MSLYRYLCPAALAGAALLMPSVALAGGTETAVDPFVFRLSVFVMAIFVGYYVVWSVTPALHTPLMSAGGGCGSARPCHQRLR
jgi:NAD(P) transhydrogenase subunit alpha